jgi:predicted RNase H-like nuclease (RuvC/YqgF family)
LTKLCGSCGKELHDYERFCDRCGAVQPPRSRQPYRKPADSVPTTELESLRARLETKIGNLEARLSQSVPRQEIDRLHVRLRQLESLLAQSVPRREAKAEADSLRANVAELQDRLAGSVPKAILEAKVNELESAGKTIEDLREQLSRSSTKIDELQNKLSDSVPRSELETVKTQLESNIVDLKAKLTFSAPRSETEGLTTGTPVTSRPSQTSARKAGPSKCPVCKYRNRPGAIYCASCGHKL